VIDGRTGAFFDEPTAESLAEAIRRLDSMTLDPALNRTRAEEFDVAVFRARWRDLFARLGADPSLYLPA